MPGSQYLHALDRTRHTQHEPQTIRKDEDGLGRYETACQREYDQDHGNSPLGSQRQDPPLTEQYTQSMNHVQSVVSRVSLWSQPPTRHFRHFILASAQTYKSVRIHNVSPPNANYLTSP